MSSGQRAYEAKRAAKAGVSLDKWLDGKQRQAADVARPLQSARPVKKPGLFSRLLERAQRPLKT